MGDWNISRRRYYGLPLPFYPCSCGHLNVIGSKAELLERSTSAVREEDLPELHRPWIDNVVIACEKCGEPVSRIPGSATSGRRRHRPFWTLGWQNPSGSRAATRRAPPRGSPAPTSPTRVREQWFPADWVSEMREQIRLWFYSQLFMSRRPRRAGAVSVGARLREDARRARARDDGSWGNLIPAEDAFERRARTSCGGSTASSPRTGTPLRLRAGARDQAEAAHPRELRLVPRHIHLDRAVEPPLRGALDGTLHKRLRPLDRWLLARVQQFVDEASEAYDAYLTVKRHREFDEFVDDVSTWYVRRAAALLGRGRGCVRDPVVRTRAVAAHHGAGHPVLTEHLWQNLVAGLRGAPRAFPRRLARVGRQAARSRSARGGGTGRRWPSLLARRVSRQVSSSASRCGASSSRPRTQDAARVISGRSRTSPASCA